MNNKNSIKLTSDKIHQYIFLLLSLAFYLFFFFYDGYVICADTDSYICMSYTREPLYSLYLAFFRTIFANQGNFYLLIAVLGQSLLAAYVAYNITVYLLKEFKLPSWVGYLLLAMPLATSFLCRFAAKRASMYSNSILTEGITISLYILFIRYCFEYIMHHSKKSFIWCFALCWIGISSRKQMAVLLAIFALAIVYTGVKKHFSKALIQAVLTTVCVLLLVVVFDKGYNYILRGEFEGHVDDNRFVATMVFYTADRDYADYIENKEIRQVFLDVYDICNKNGYLMNNAPTGWFDEVSHFADHYDMIQLDTLSLYLIDKIPDIEYGKGTASDSIRIDMIKSEMISALLPHEIPRIIKVMFNNFLAGMVNTVAQRTPLLCMYSVFIYVCYFALLTFLFIRGKRTGFTYTNKLTLTFAILVMISTICNVTLVAAVIFCQTRYVIYNMALFYMAGILMLYELYRQIFKKSGQGIH